MKRNTIIKVLNRDNGAVCYSIPEMNGLTRIFQAGEVKEVTFEELQKLSYIPGGSDLLKDSLVIMNNDIAISELIGHVEPQYSYTKQDILHLLKQGSLDELLDCLDFAPQGVKELVKTLSVEMPLNDVAKREAILDKLGFNVDNAIRIKRQVMTDSQKPMTAPDRRVKIETKNTTTRRTLIKE